MTHLWVRAEQRSNERRVGVTPAGVADLVRAGVAVTVEHSATRAIPTGAFRAAGAGIAPEGSWPDAPADALIFGLKELPGDATPLRHRHVMFGHAFKDQPDGRLLLDRFRDGGGTLYDLEYLVDGDGGRVAAFGYWAGHVGAALSLMAWAAQRRGEICPPARIFADADTLVETVRDDIARSTRDAPTMLVVGALGRVGTGAADLGRAAGLVPTLWDVAETAHGGPFPEVLEHDVMLNCILARPGCPVFVPADTPRMPRALTVIGDIACDPTSDFSPIRVYDRPTTWEAPVLRVHDTPPLDVMAIDNLPSMLPLEASEDFAAQLLPSLLALPRIDEGVWRRAEAEFRRHMPVQPKSR